MAKTKRATKTAKVNKSAAIRDYKAAHPDAGPTAIADALTAKGINTSAAAVSVVLGNARRSDGKGRKAKARKGRAPRGDMAKLTIGDLMDARQFVKSCGGEAKAIKAVESVSAFIDSVGGISNARQLLSLAAKYR